MTHEQIVAAALQRRRHIRELYRRLGSLAAVARELGISRVRVRQLLLRDDDYYIKDTIATSDPAALSARRSDARMAPIFDQVLTRLRQRGLASE